MQDGGTLLVDGEQQPREYDTLNAIYPLRAAASHGDGRFDLSIEPTALIPSVPTARTAYVDALNGDDGTGQVGERTFPYQTVAAARNAIVLLGPSQGSPYLLQVHPGQHTVAPLVLPSWVTLASSDGPGTVTLVASNPASPLLTASADSIVSGVTLAGGSVGLLATAGQVTVTGCVLTASETLARATGAGTQLTMSGCVGSADGSSLAGFEALSGGRLAALGCTITGAPGDPIAGAGLRADGAGSELIPDGTAAFFCDVGLRVTAGGLVRGADSNVRFCDVGLQIAASGGTIELASTSVTDSTTDDVQVLSASGRLTVSGLLHEKAPNVVAGADVFGMLLDRVTQVTTTEGTLCSGSPDRPGIFASGQGCPTVEGLHAWHYDPTATRCTSAPISPSPASSC
jgi:hypothetical protein